MKLQPLDPQRARTRKLAALARLVRREGFASEVAAGASLHDFLDSLPEVLGAAQLRELARAIAEASRGNRAVLLMSGAHPIKVGLGPIICGLLRDGIVDAIATNGAAIIHDFELAFAGRTSEDVGAGLSEGIFGMAEETGAFLNRAAKLAAAERKGLGEIVGREILEAQTEVPRAQRVRDRVPNWRSGHGSRHGRRRHHSYASGCGWRGDWRGNDGGFSSSRRGGRGALARSGD